jgi:hypothetical protein
MNVPSTVIIQQHRDEVLGELRQSIKAIQTSINALKTISDFSVPQSADPAQWAKALAAANERKDTAYRAINDNLAFTCEQKAESLKAWRSWHFVISKHIGGIIRALQKWPTAAWRWDMQGQNIVPGCSTYSIADMMATKPVPPECQEHAEKVDAVRQSILTLREWEQQHGIRKLPIEPLLKTDIESLCVQWATGSILRQHGLDNVTASRVAVFESTFI